MAHLSPYSAPPLRSSYLRDIDCLGLAQVLPILPMNGWWSYFSSEVGEVDSFLCGGFVWVPLSKGYCLFSSFCLFFLVELAWSSLFLVLVIASVWSLCCLL